MAGAAYKIKVRRDVGGTPLLVVTFQVEYEVVLSKDRFVDFKNSVIKYADGVSGEKLTQDEFRLWDDELRRMWNFRQSMSELPAYALTDIETKPAPIPRGLVHKILTDFEENTSQSINIFVTGEYPEFKLNLNWGTISYSMSLMRSEMQSNIATFSMLSAEAQKCVDDGKPIDEVKKIVKEVGGAINDTEKITVDVVECVIAIAIACETIIAIPVVFKTCSEAINTVQEVIEATEKAKKEKEQAERQKREQEKEEAIDRACRCREAREAGIGRARDFDHADIISRTA